MKKIMTILLCAVLLLSAAGCAAEETSGEFDHIVRYLERGDYDKAREAIDELEGIESHAPEMEETAPPEPTEEEERETESSGSYVSLLSGLTITRVDNLGNEDTDGYYFYNYDEQGRIVKIGGHEMAMDYGFYLHTFADYLKITYNADGVVENLMVTDSWDDVSALGTPTYDENGNMVSLHIQTNTEEYTLNFAYDANGNRIRADIFDTFWQEISFAVTYTYDAEGCLVKEHWDMVGFGNTGRTVEYTYGDDGRLAQSYLTWHTNPQRHDTTVYFYNESGALIQAITTSDSVDSGYKTKTIDFEYTDIKVGS